MCNWYQLTDFNFVALQIPSAYNLYNCHIIMSSLAYIVYCVHVLFSHFCMFCPERLPTEKTVRECMSGRNITEILIELVVVSRKQ